MSRFASSRAALLAVGAAFAVACEIGTIDIPKTTATVVVHGVLNPSAPNQVILVERTLTGAVQIPDTTFDASDPIVSAGGVAVSNATVEIIDSSGRVTQGVEDRSVPANNGKGAGVYRVPIPGPGIVLGARYRLHIHTAEGEDVTASTLVPRPATRLSNGLTRTFNRDHDFIVAGWGAAPLTRAYAVRIESPFGPFFLFTDSLTFRTNGDLRNLFSSDLQRVFIPGFHQDMLIAAVDSNFYDYYRTNNDPFTGAGIISRINGGLGMFAALVTLNTGTITVTADQTEPIEARFRLAPTSNDPSIPTQLTLYIESPPAKADAPAALSGRYQLGNSTTRGDGIIGQLRGPDVSLALLSGQLAGDTVDVFIGELAGDTLRGTYQKLRTPALFIRAP
ncbi:MAG: DUF4249 family protein [Gemmatimonadaceae bacterium]